jgi:predicted phage terminase large subunit-like protein
MLKVTLNGKMISVTEQEYQVLLRHDPYLFIERAFYELNPQTPFVPNWHIERIAQELEECRLGRTKRLIINEPPRSLKSHCASIAYPALLLGHNPSAQVICVSYGQDLANTLAGNCRTLMSSAFYQSLFPTRLAQKKQAIHDFYTTEQGFRMATSVGGVLTGRGADTLIIDDPLKPDEAASESQRKATNDWYDHTLLTRLNDKRTGCIIIIMQRLHEDDLVGHVLNSDEWKILRFPAIAEEDERHEICSLNKTRVVNRKQGEPLHPEREPIETLNAIREVLGEYQFAGQYQQSPAPLAGGMVKGRWFQRYAPHQLPQKFELIFQSWDTANKAAEINDFSVCTTWGMSDKHLYLLDVFRARMEYPELKRTIVRLAELHKAQYVVIEDRASGTQLLQDLKNDGFDRATAFESEGDKAMRMFAVTNTIENGFVHVPETADWVEPYLYELMVFQNGKFDDQVDSTSQALEWVRNRYFNYRLPLVEYLKREKQRLANPASKEPPNCSNCKVPIKQKIPGGFRCANCGEQWSPLPKPWIPSRRDLKW